MQCWYYWGNSDCFRNPVPEFKAVFSKHWISKQETGWSTQPDIDSLTKALLNCQPVVTMDWFHHVSCFAEPHTATPLTDLWARSRHMTFNQPDQPYLYSIHSHKHHKFWFHFESLILCSTESCNEAHNTWFKLTSFWWSKTEKSAILFCCLPLHFNCFHPQLCG